MIAKRIHNGIGAGAVLLLLLTCMVSCFEPEPTRISVACTHHGKQKSCTVVLSDSNDRELQRSSTNIRGITEFKHIVPGKYILRFTDNKNQSWPAERYIKLESGRVLAVRVELNEATDDLFLPEASTGEEETDEMVDTE